MPERVVPERVPERAVASEPASRPAAGVTEPRLPAGDGAVGRMHASDVVESPTVSAAPEPAASPVAAPADSGTLYVIPGCYAGNVRPDAQRLPKGCDPARTTIVAR